MDAAHFLLISLIAILTRWCISLNKYSGAGKPPMFGDYEAQRHWMEITYNLPVNEWYQNSSKNDLLYWGLDYPPLTAYHSWINGYIANKINPDWVELRASRGYESASHKLFMRYSVLAVDLIVFFPAVFLLSLVCQGNYSNKVGQSLGVLLYPGLILIDYGHFQYNCVSLGLFLLSVYFMSTKRELCSSVTFVMALNYKQMELYHAFPFFFYLLGLCLTDHSQNGVVRLFKIGMTVLLSFALCWFPFIQSAESMMQVLQRLFPFNRGLFEDKVANVWCTLSLVVKLKSIFLRETLVFICFSSTLIMSLPSSLHLLFSPSIKKFKYSLINCSLVFFLFSYQVHEKSILIPAVMVNLMCIDHPFLNLWFSIISTFSMLPLLQKDGQTLAYFASTLLYVIICVQSTPIFEDQAQSSKPWWHRVLKYVFFQSTLGAILLSLGSIFITPPSHLPDLFPVLISAYSCIHFVLFAFFFHFKQFTCEKITKLQIKSERRKKKKQ